MKELNLADILEKTSDLSEKKVWYVSIIGRPNVGKSTFINTLLWEKVSITTNVPQTTRKKVLAIYNDKESQIIFFDTPGIHKSNKQFNEEINNQAISSLKESDLVLYFIDASREGWEEEKYISQIIENLPSNKKVFRVYTKSDLPAKIVPKVSRSNFHISSNASTWLDNLIDAIKSQLPIWPMQFWDDFYTKQSMNFRISEIIREKVFLHTKEEIPHATYIWVEEIQDDEDMLRLVAYVYAESDSQKYVLIWKWGSLITKIWKEARIELERVFDKKVFLALRVKVKKNWRKDQRLVKEILQ